MSTVSSIDLAALRNTLSDALSSQSGVLAAYLFGSVARGQANPLSDVDIAVLLMPDLDAEAMLEKQLELVGMLEDIIGREAQVVILNKAPLLLADQVIREGVILCEQDRQARIAFVVRTMKLYFDIQPMLEFQHRNISRHIREAGLGQRRRSSTRTLESAERIRQRLAGIARR
ncbi:MAG: type VII toxin-antitoxin system MntA family adenylyltransferase antitoxin [Chloroflexota bacterium]